MRILRHKQSGEFIPHPRTDDEPAVGLDPAYEEFWLVEKQRPVLTPQQAAERFEEVDEKTKTITRGWRITHLPEPPPPEPEPRWVEFGAALVADPDINQFIGGIAQAAPVLHLMLGVGLGQAAQGDSRTFLTAWAGTLAAELVPNELVEHLQRAAAGFDLPADFIAELQGPPTP